jgi:acetate kinase
MAETILVLNAGSSSIKFQLFAVGGDGLVRRLKGQSMASARTRICWQRARTGRP